MVYIESGAVYKIVNTKSQDHQIVVDLSAGDGTTGVPGVLPLSNVDSNLIQQSLGTTIMEAPTSMQVICSPTQSLLI